MPNSTIYPPKPPVNLLQATEQAFTLASQGLLSVTDLFTVAQQITDIEQPDIAIQLYKTWLEHTASQIAYAVQFNLGVTLSNNNDDTGAEEAYRAAIAQKPNFIEGLFNLGILLERTNRFEEALDMWRTALTLTNPADYALYAQALSNLSRLLEICKELPEAEVVLTQSLLEEVFSQVASKDLDSQAAAQINVSASPLSDQVSTIIRLNNKDISLKNVLVVYTVLLGDKEPLGDPLINLPPGSSTDINIDFICFTDNRSLKSNTWKFEYLDSIHLPADKLSRRPKTLPHEYLPQYDTSLYIDNIVTFKRLPNSHDLITSNSYLFRVFLHGNRESLFHEADAIALLGYENIDVICTQLDFYTQICAIDTITPISTCTIILRTHHHPKLVEFGSSWWEQILNFSKRDQLSFDFTVLQTGCRIDYLNGLMSDNDLVHSTPNMSDRRIKASFDSVKYAWVNRHDPEAKRNPKAHFLANDSASSSDYTKRSALFDYICHKTGSSLGSHIAPRRAVAGTLNEIMLPYRKSSGNMLLVQIQGDKSSLNFLEEEFHPAESAFNFMLNNYSASRVNLASDLPDLSFMSAELKYDVLVLFGLPPDCCYSFIEKCVSVLNGSRGLIVVLMTGEGDLALIKNTQNLICSRFATECKASVSHSSHDDFNSLISNSLICFEWKTLLATE